MIDLGHYLRDHHGLREPAAMARNIEKPNGLLWILMLAFPLPYIANTLGWMTAELGRQPWLVYGLFTRRSAQPCREHRRRALHFDWVAGLYFVLGVLYLYLTGREIGLRPDTTSN